MRTKSLLFALMVFAIGFTACVEKDPFEYEFAKETVDEGKANVEQSGVDMVQNVSQLINSKGVEAADVFVHFMSNTSSQKRVLASPFMSPYRTLHQLKRGDANPADLFNSMQLFEDSLIFEPISYEEDYPEIESFQELFNEFTGVWSWNSRTNSWDEAPAANRIEFHFPSTKNGTSNNASIVITYTGSTTVPSPIEEYSGDMPISLKTTLTSAGNVEVEYTIDLEYDAEGVPTSIISKLMVSEFNFQAKWTYSTTNASIAYSMKNGDNTLMDAKLEVAGRLSKDDLDRAMNYESETYIEDLINTANAHLQVMDIKIVGNVDVKAMNQADNTIYPEGYWENENFDYAQADSLMADAYNKNTNLVVVYVEDRRKIADVEAYQYMESYSYWDDWQGEYVEEEYSTIGYRLKFADSSTVDFETYFGSGFDGVITEMNKLISQMNNRWELGMELMEYN